MRTYLTIGICLIVPLLLCNYFAYLNVLIHLRHSPDRSAACSIFSPGALARSTFAATASLLAFSTLVDCLYRPPIPLLDSLVLNPVAAVSSVVALVALIALLTFAAHHLERTPVHPEDGNGRD